MTLKTTLLVGGGDFRGGVIAAIGLAQAAPPVHSRPSCALGSPENRDQCRTVVCRNCAGNQLTACLDWCDALYP